MFHRYDYFSASVPFFKISDSFSRLAQRVTSIYDGYNSPGFKKIFQKNQVLRTYVRHK